MTDNKTSAQFMIAKNLQDLVMHHLPEGAKDA